MGKGLKTKKYLVLSGFDTNNNNRGTAALSYGAIEFCRNNRLLLDNQEILTIQPVWKFWKYKDKSETYSINGKVVIRRVVYVNIIEIKIHERLGFLIPFSKYKRLLNDTDKVAAINGGDGYSDIYGDRTFLCRLGDINNALIEKIPVVFLPQTLGPFNSDDLRNYANLILSKAEGVYIRDEKYIEELNRIGVSYKLSKDLSAYMQPEPWKFECKPNSIGINVNGLCYSNQFKSLSGQFCLYPLLINRIIMYFQKKGLSVYLIPHSYNISNPEVANDDVIACREVYNNLDNKNNVYLIDNDLTAPQIKYSISKMSFFIGSRMHANFAAIYSNVPLFGLAYSYKFAGAFTSNGLDGEKQTVMINNIQEKDIDDIIKKIESFYNSVIYNE